MVFDCGCAISTKPVGLVNVPTPGIAIERPFPDGSVTFQAKRTVAAPPCVTALGVAVKELMVGAGQGLTVTVVCAVLVAPQPERACNA